MATWLPYKSIIDVPIIDNLCYILMDMCFHMYIAAVLTITAAELYLLQHQK